MGIESANYTIFPGADCEAVDEVLLRAKAVPVSTSSPVGFQKWVVRGDRYWIDLMRGNFGPARREALSIRIALCNPLDADEVLRTTLGGLLTELRGTLMDGQTKRTYETLDDEAWNEIVVALTIKRDQFRQFFGALEAPIGGDEVFAELRKRNGAES